MRDLNDVLDLDLKLPIGGKTYLIEPPSAADGVDLMNRLAFGIYADAGLPMDDDVRGAIEITDEQMPDFARQCLGKALDEMQADGVHRIKIEFAVQTAFLAWTVGKEYAETFWETAGNLERPTEKKSERPTATPTRSAAASGTPTSASASGTTRTRRKAKAKAAPSSSSGANTAT